MVSRVGGPRPKPPPQPIIRPLYGVVIRDNVAAIRSQISGTLDQTTAAIKKGKPNAKVVNNDGILQGAELTKAKAAAKELDKAVKALKPVFGDGGGPIINPIMNPASNNNVIRPLYGVVFRDDLSNFRDSINTNINSINGAITSGQLKGDAKTEAQKAVKYLKTALKDLGSAADSWPAR